MGYVAVKGGQEAIAEANLRLDYERVRLHRFLEIKDILAGMKPLIDQVMSESSLYDETLAALAIKQAGGSMEEAVFLLRAHRSTLSRLHYTTITDTRTMYVKRRISASFKDILGGQILGTCLDFKQRFLDFDLLAETQETLEKTISTYHHRIIPQTSLKLRELPKVVDTLRSLGLYKDPPFVDDLDDITKNSIQFPSSRSQRLQSLTRGQTGAVTSLGYAEIRGFGISNHPNIGELRVGELPLHIQAFHDDDEYYIGSITVTEVESFIPVDFKNEHKDTQIRFKIGYGLTFGHNETKTIAMSVLDAALSDPESNHPSANDEFVLLHIDSVESSGFISHLKLPHYVTFQSLLDGIRKIDKNKDEES